MEYDAFMRHTCVEISVTLCHGPCSLQYMHMLCMCAIPFTHQEAHTATYITFCLMYVQLPLMGECLKRGYRVTIFCPSTPKFRNTLNQWGLEAVQVIGYEAPLEFKEVMMEEGVWKVLKDGGPLANASKQIFPLMVDHYSKESQQLPVVVVSDFFATSALDAGDYLKVPTIGFFPNPAGMTSLLAPHLRSWLDMPHVWLCLLGEAVLARLLLLGRNRERYRRAAKYRLEPLLEQDVFPSLCMQRPFLASTAVGFEYAFPHSPLLQFMGPSPPTNASTRDFKKSAPDVFNWMNQQEYVVYVAFGTMHHFTEETVNTLYQQLRNVSIAAPSRIGHRVSVLWSLPSDQQQMLRTSQDDHTVNHIRLESFVPQWDVLASSKVVVFVSHCGANSLYESLLNGKPLVCCPGKADQPANAARVVSSNTGILSKNDVHGVEVALMEALTSLDMLRENTQKVRNIFLSQGGVVTGANFVDKIVKCGTRHLTLPYNHCGRYSWSKWILVGITISIAVVAINIQLIEK